MPLATVKLPAMCLPFSKALPFSGPSQTSQADFSCDLPPVGLRSRFHSLFRRGGRHIASARGGSRRGHGPLLLLLSPLLIGLGIAGFLAGHQLPIFRNNAVPEVFGEQAILALEDLLTGRLSVGAVFVRQELHHETLYEFLGGSIFGFDS